MRVERTASPSCSWNPLTVDQWRAEWRSEPDLRRTFDALNSSLLDSPNDPYNTTRQFEFMIRSIPRISNIRRFDMTGLDAPYPANSLDELDFEVSSFGKDVFSIASMMNGGELPCPVLLDDFGTIVVLGGRTRISVAKLIGCPVSALIISRELLNKVMLNFIKETFLQGLNDCFGFENGLRESIWDEFDRGECAEHLNPYDDSFDRYLFDMCLEAVGRAFRKYGDPGTHEVVPMLNCL